MDAEWEQEASLKLRAMNPAATDIYAKYGRIRDYDDLVGLLDELVIRWDDGPDGSTRTVGVGDRIRTRRNDYGLVAATRAPVTNGAAWEVTHVRNGGLWVRSDERGHLFLPPSYLAKRDEETDRPFVELAYASTVHSAQGHTVDQAVMVVGAHTEAELLYVGMTRGRSSNIAVADLGDDDGLTLFAAALQNPSSDTVAVPRRDRRTTRGRGRRQESRPRTGRTGRSREGSPRAGRAGASGTGRGAGHGGPKVAVGSPRRAKARRGSRPGRCAALGASRRCRRSGRRLPAGTAGNRPGAVAAGGVPAIGGGRAGQGTRGHPTRAARYRAAVADRQAQEREAREQNRPSLGGPGLGGL